MPIVAVADTDPTVGGRIALVVGVHVAGWLLVGLVVGAVLGGPGVGALVGLVLGAALTAVLARWSAQILLVTARARPAPVRDYARLHNLVDGLCATTGVPLPGIHVIDDPAPNALVVTVGPRRSAVAVTTGLLSSVDRVQLESIVAWLLVQVRQRSLVPVTLAAVLLGWPVLLADGAIRWAWWNGGRRPRQGDHPDRSVVLALPGFALLPLAPLVAIVMRPLTGQDRGPSDDLLAVQVTRYPPALAKALAVLAADSTVTHAAVRPTTALWLARPLGTDASEGRLTWWNRLFEVHAPIDDRVALLREL